jgi:phosphoglycolate phosphatase
VASEQRISLVCFGLIGTLVDDGGVVDQSFAEAIATQGVVSGTSAYTRRMTQVYQARGHAPGELLRLLFPDNQARAQAAELAFGKALADAMARKPVKAIPGAQEVLDELGRAGCRLCVMTTLPGRLLDSALDSVGWRDVFDAAVSADDVPRGCPAPDLALLAMLRVGVGDVRELAMVAATGAGVECGRRAGARVSVGLLTGPHSVARLQAAGATRVIDSIADLPGVLATAGGVGAGPVLESGISRSSESGGRGSAARYAAPVNIPWQAPLEPLEQGSQTS